MKREHAMLLAECDGIKHYPGYSGRDMMGSTTDAVTCDGWAVFCGAVARVAAYLGDHDHRDSDADGLEYEFVTAMGHIRHDSLGRGLVIY